MCCCGSHRGPSISLSVPLKTPQITPWGARAHAHARVRAHTHTYTFGKAHKIDLHAHAVSGRGQCRECEITERRCEVSSHSTNFSLSQDKRFAWTWLFPVTFPFLPLLSQPVLFDSDTQRDASQSLCARQVTCDLQSPSVSDAERRSRF